MPSPNRSLARKKDEFKSDLKHIKQTLQPAIDGVGESLDDIGRQAREKFDDLKKTPQSAFSLIPCSRSVDRPKISLA